MQTCKHERIYGIEVKYYNVNIKTGELEELISDDLIEYKCQFCGTEFQNIEDIKANS